MTAQPAQLLPDGSDEPVLDAALFFESMLPALMHQRAATAATLRGTLSIMVQGEGAWLVRLGSRPSVEQGVDFDADLVVTFTPASFRTLLATGSLDPNGGDRVCGMVCMGDESMLEKLGRLLVEPARGGLAARLACA